MIPTELISAIISNGAMACIGILGIALFGALIVIWTLDD